MPPNPQNLRPRPPWPKGVSGNPKGRPPRALAFEDFLKLLDENPEERRELSKVWLARCKAGDFQFFREYLDRSDGKPVPMAEEPESDGDEDTGILVRVPTVRQAERLEKSKARAKAKKTPRAKKKPAGGSADGPAPA